MKSECDQTQKDIVISTYSAGWLLLEALFCPAQRKMFASNIQIALMHVYVTQANFTTKPRFEIKNKRSFTEMNSQGSRVEKNTQAQKVQMQKILFTNEACW